MINRLRLGWAGWEEAGCSGPWEQRLQALGVQVSAGGRSPGGQAPPAPHGESAGWGGRSPGTRAAGGPRPFLLKAGWGVRGTSGPDDCGAHAVPPLLDVTCWSEGHARSGLGGSIVGFCLLLFSAALPGPGGRTCALELLLPLPWQRGGLGGLSAV